MASEVDGPAVQRRVLDGWLRVLTLLEGGIGMLEKAGELPPKEFAETFKITSLEIRVALKELPKKQTPAQSTDKRKRLSELKLVS